MNETEGQTEAAPQAPPERPKRLAEENEASVVGRMINHPKVRVAGGSKMAKFILAVPRSFKNAQSAWVTETAFVPVVAWRALAEACETLGKGSAVRVQGCLKTWELDGMKYRWEIQADLLEVLDRRPMPPAAETPQPEQKELLAH